MGAFLVHLVGKLTSSDGHTNRPIVAVAANHDHLKPVGWPVPAALSSTITHAVAQVGEGGGLLAQKGVCAALAGVLGFMVWVTPEG